MRFIRGSRHLRPEHQNTVVTLGNFDGVHLGHQALVEAVTQQAIDRMCQSTVVLFEPQPNEYFAGLKAPARLMRLREKVSALAALDVDQILCLRFDQALAALSAEDFVTKILVDGLAVKHVVIGDDFRFGHQRRGDFQLLETMGQAHGFTVAAMPTRYLEQSRISSTAVRAALAHGDMSQAAALLGRAFFMSGKVAHGHKRGRMIGFPTANIHLHRQVVPVQGIFVVQVDGLAESPVNGVANVGNRPIIADPRTLLEVHLFDFNREIYGEQVRVNFLHKLRDEAHYDNFDELKRQIIQDAAQAQAFFHQQASNT